MRPLIGVTTSEVRRGELATLRRHGEPPHPEMALGMTYLRAIDAAGGVPVVLPPVGLDAVPELIERLDGVCLSGGPDLDPDAYGAATRHPELGPTEPGLDAFELAVAHAADAAGLPLLGICRGAQAINVARGGTLHQHVEGHRQAALATARTHTVTVDDDSLLASLTGPGSLEVNSFHHQAVDIPGAGLRIVARAIDGTVEAIEDRTRPLLLGVQWHAETLADRPEHGALFAALVEIAAEEPRRLAAAA
ncbi:MAG TPA: gamma-glutamyl-gamma-aminobutyrate hydrolase family protein [Solirubrobacteraceae bacterium]|jgi:putative glutamine amidotransferase|nr:gamma-glutamyl-gamma-aminobutyrate hydrolase family protein [Solirubrobacteraceae bacterium]